MTPRIVLNTLLAPQIHHPSVVKGKTLVHGCMIPLDDLHFCYVIVFYVCEKIIMYIIRIIVCSSNFISKNPKNSELASLL